MIVINSRLSLPDDAVKFTFSRSGGPGGQNVNKVSTRATLWFDISGSPYLSDSQKERVIQRLGNRVSKEGVVQVVSMQFRTQKANREDALRRFSALLAASLYEKPRRKKTGVPRRAKESRLQSKKRRSMLKSGRTKKSWDD